MKYPQILLVIFLSSIVTSCFQNTDFDQANDVVITPVVELDLIYFDIDASQFYDVETNTPNLVVRDTTAIEFIDGNDIRDALVRAEFLFDFTNSIPSNFSVNFDFLNTNNEVRYSSFTQVNAGSASLPVETIYIDNVENEEIENLTSSNKVVISVTIPSSSSSLFGTLNLKSKATYYLEID
ncbi:hypothetical protein [Patiriisocius marinus]|nr:hypothetical protein [Patiriisocius marinus]